MARTAALRRATFATYWKSTNSGRSPRTGSLEPGGGTDDILVLVVEVLAPLGEADGGESFAVEGGVVSAAAVAVRPGDQGCEERRIRGRSEVGAGGVGHGAGKLAAGRIVLLAEAPDAARLFRRGGNGNALGEDPYPVLHLQHIAGSGVSTHDVVVENSFELPALFAGEVRQVSRTNQALFFAGHGGKHQGGGKVEFAQGARAFERNRHAGGIVVGAGRSAGSVSPVFEDVGVDGIVMSGDQVHAFGLRRIGAAQDGVDVGDSRGARNAAGPGFVARFAAGGIGNEGVPLDFEAPAAGLRDLRELGRDPVGRGLDALAGRKPGIHAGGRVAGAETNQRLDRSVQCVRGRWRQAP